MNWLIDPFQYEFMQRALIEVLLVGIVCGTVGCFVVLRGLAFIGDALAHTVFPGVVLSYMWNKNILVGAFAFGGITAAGIGFLSRSRRVTEDTAVGVVFAALFAFGVVLISKQTGFRQDLSSLLFGNVLGVSWTDVWETGAIAAVVVVILVALFKEFTLVAFDSTMARAAGYPVFTLDLVLLLLVAAAVVASLHTVGNILILALLVTPPATARLLTDRLVRMVLFSTVVACISGAIGLLISFHFDTAAGGTIVLTATALFGVALVAAPTHGLLGTYRLRRRGEHHRHHYHLPGEVSHH